MHPGQGRDTEQMVASLVRLAHVQLAERHGQPVAGRSEIHARVTGRIIDVLGNLHTSTVDK